MTLTFYNTAIRPELNGVFEDIETYLATKTPVYETEYKSFGIFHVNESVKLPIAYLKASRSSLEVGNYCKADDGTNVYYYFVTGAERKGSETVQLTLVMDTLTTFQSEVTLTDRTHVTRKFFDRFDFSKDTPTPVVNANPETIGDVPLFMDSETARVDSASELYHYWYLIAQSQSFNTYTADSSSGETTYETSGKTAVFYTLVPQVAVSVIKPVSPYAGVKLTYDDLPDGWFIVNGNAYPSAAIQNQNHASGETSTLYNSAGWYLVIGKDRTTNRIVIQKRAISHSGGTATEIDCDWIKFTTEFTMYRQSGDYPWLTTWYAFEQSSWSYPISINSTSEIMSIYPFSEWMKTHGSDSSIIRILECPYCPYDMTVTSSGILEVPDKDAQITNDGIYLPSSVEFARKLPSWAMDYYTPVKNAVVYSGTKEVIRRFVNRGGAAREYCKKWETKLLNSAYNYYSFDYDSSRVIFRPELLTRWDTEVTISYFVSKADPTMAFKFDSAQKLENPGDNYFICQRNNEVPYYTDEYLNYLRYGKAADNKKLGQDIAQSVVSGIGTGVSTAGSIAMIAKTSVDAVTGPVGWAIGGISAAVGLATMAISMSTKLANDADAMASKAAQLGNTAVKQSTSSDATVYHDLGLQHLFVRHYSPKDETAESLYDYFRLYGYACDTYEIPKSTRYWTDFFQCEPVFDGSVWQEIKDDLEARWKMGVTVYHWHDRYDFQRVYENWENAAVEWAKS